MTDIIDYNKFVDEELGKLGFRIQLITEEVMKKNIRKFSKFINEAFAEYYDVYKWRKHADDTYLLNPLKDKFKFSSCILDSKDNICLVNFTSVLDGKLNYHFTFASKNTRNMNLAKYHIIQLCQRGLEYGYGHQAGYWPKNNNGSIILFLKMGWQISHIREDGILILLADNAKVIQQTYKLLTETK